MDAFSGMRIRVRQMLTRTVDETEPGLPDHELRMKVNSLMDDLDVDDAMAMIAEAAATDHEIIDDEAA